MVGQGAAHRRSEVVSMQRGARDASPTPAIGGTMAALATSSIDAPSALDADAAIRVVLVNDDALLVEALAAALTAAGPFEVAGTTADVETAIRLVAFARPDVVVVDHRPPSVREFELVEALKLLRPAPAVLLVSSSDAPAVALHAVKAQCEGLLSRRASLADFMDAVRTIASGQCVYTNDQLIGALGGDVAKDSDEPQPDLTQRELEILWLLNDGTATDVIAQSLRVSINTVRSHIRSILVKFGAHSRLEAIAAARRSGLLDELDDRRGRSRSAVG
jgi:DNA-binding NarL/FixJ family response regulator